MNDKCDIGKKLHKWGKWSPYDSYKVECRICKRCGKRQNRFIELLSDKPLKGE